MSRHSFMSFFRFGLICKVLFAIGIADSTAQTGIYADNVAYRAGLDSMFADTASSPLSPAEISGFKGLPFFPIDTAYAVRARFNRIRRPTTIEIPNTKGGKVKYDIFANVEFELNGKECRLFVYQSHKLRATTEHRDHLLLAFRDLTSGNQTYGGGRFINMNIPEGKEVLIDFNKAYNPLCAYSTKYACPITPKENFLDVEVRAGVMIGDGH